MVSKILLWIVMLYLLWVVLLFVGQRWVLFPRYTVNPYQQLPESDSPVERLWMEREGRKLEAWFIAGWGVSAEKPGPVILFFHGNGELIDHWPDRLAGFSPMGVSIFLPEYRGYGRTEGWPSEDDLEADMQAWLDRLLARPDVDKDRLVYFGRSLGGGLACGLARVHKPRGLILSSAFTRVPDLAHRFGVPGFLVRDSFDNRAVLSQLDIPVLLLHGTNDTLVPYSHALENQAAAKQAELWSFECAHANCPPDWISFYRKIRGVLEAWGVISPKT